MENKKCNKECQVYCRIVGFYRPENTANKGKREEIKTRKNFVVEE